MLEILLRGCRRTRGDPCDGRNGGGEQVGGEPGDDPSVERVLEELMRLDDLLVIYLDSGDCPCQWAWM